MDKPCLLFQFLLIISLSVNQQKTVTHLIVINVYYKIRNTPFIHHKSISEFVQTKFQKWNNSKSIVQY